MITDSFVKKYLSLVEALATNIMNSNYIPTGIERDDLISWGMEGLIKAKRRFDSDKGSQFKTYAYYRIRGEILDRLRKEWRYRNPTEYQAHKDKLRARIAEMASETLHDRASEAGDPVQSAENLVTNAAMMYMVSLDTYDELPTPAEGANPEELFIDQDNTVLWEEIRKLSRDEQQFIDLFYVQGYKQKDIAETLNSSRSSICRMHTKLLDKLKLRLQRRVESVYD